MVKPGEAGMWLNRAPWKEGGGRFRWWHVDLVSCPTLAEADPALWAGLDETERMCLRDSDQGGW